MYSLNGPQVLRINPQEIMLWHQILDWFYVLFVLRIISISLMTFLTGTTGRTCDRPHRKELRLITIKTVSASPPSSQPHWWGKRMTSSLLSSSHPPSSPALLFLFLSSFCSNTLRSFLSLRGLCLLLFLFNSLFIWKRFKTKTVLLFSFTLTSVVKATWFSQ